MKRLSLLILLAAFAGVAQATELALDPGTGLQQFSTNVNDGYSSARGMLFTMNSTVQVDSFGYFTSNTPGPDVWTLRLVTTLTGNVDTGSTLITTVNDTLPSGGLQYYDTPTFTPVTLIAGNSYHLELAYNQAAAINDFYNWNGVPPVNLGSLTLIDGTQGGDTSNSVAPPFRMDVVAAPEPVSLASLALGAGLLIRRKRRN